MLRGLCLFDHRFPPRPVDGLRSSLRVAQWRPSVGPTDGCFPRPEGESHTRSLLPLPEVSLPKGPRGDLPSSSGDVGQHRFLPSDCPFLCSQTGTPHGNQTGRAKGCFSQRLPEGAMASFGSGERRHRYSLREPSMAFSASRPRGTLPSNQRGSQLWYNSANKGSPANTALAADA